MTQDEFFAELISDAERFKAFWLKQQGINGTEIYPDKMPAGEWGEQFITFLELKYEA